MFSTSPSLLQRLQESPEQSHWERFVDLYTPLFLCWTRKLGLDGHDAADLIQDIFAILVQKLGTFRPGEHPFRAWLKTIVLNRWRNRARTHGRVGTLQTEALEALVAPEADFNLDEVEYRRHVVNRALELIRGDFQPATWSAFLAFVVQGRPAEAVAAELGVSVNAVYMARGRVLRRVREELAGVLD